MRVACMGLVLALAVAALADGVFQWAVPVTKADGKTITAYLWVPPTAERVRGVVFGGQLLAERGLSLDDSVRAACAAEGLAIIYCKPHIDAIFNYKAGNGPKDFQAVLDACAEASGYTELKVAPFFSIGHSTSCNFATNAAAWQPSRCFGVLVFKGGLTDPTAFDPDAKLAGIPILALKGQYEEFGPGPSGVLRDFEDRETAWKTSRDRYIALRQKDERVLISLAVEAGCSHMTWTDRDGQYIALFIRKAAQARIPDWPADATEPVACKEIDVKSGALSSTAITNPSAPKAALYKDYKGDRNNAYWHVDLELAQAFEAYHAGLFNKRPQFLAFADPATGKPIYSRHDLRYDATMQWVGPDTFKVVGTWLNEARDKYPIPESAINHADTPIQFRTFHGTAAQVGPDTFQVRTDGRDGYSASVTAFHPGNAEFRFAEQPAGLKIPAPTKGKAQTITFAAIGDLRADSVVKLTATSDSGLPVSYFVASGPAVIEGDTLRVTSIPPKAKRPIAVTVGAYQWGSMVEPFVQSAPTVVQTVVVK